MMPCSVRRLQSFAPDVVGFSVITPNYPVAKEQLAQVRQLCPNAFWLPAEFTPRFSRTICWLMVLTSWCSARERKLFRSFSMPGLEADDLTAVDGLAFRDREGRVVRTPARQKTRAFDEIPMVDRRLYNLPLYAHHSMLASRGCPYKCTFCCNYTGTIMGKGSSLRSYTRVVEEMKYLEQEFDARQIFFADDIFLLKRSNILEFCDEVNRQRLRLSWIGQMRRGHHQ